MLQITKCYTTYSRYKDQNLQKEAIAMATTIELSGGHQLIDTYDFVTIIGTSGADSVTLGANVINATLYGVETVVGSAKRTDTIILGSSTAFLTVSGVESIVGSGGYDAVGLTGTTAFVTVQGIESLTDLSGVSQAVKLEGTYNNLTVNGIETVYGSNWIHDTVTLADGQNTLTIGNMRGGTVDAVIGNTSANILTIQGTNSVAVASIESIVGDNSYQRVSLSNSTNVVTISGIDQITSGTGHDTVYLADNQTSTIVSGVETLIDTAGTNQFVWLEGSTNVVTINGIETIHGSNHHDIVTLGDGQTALTVVGTKDDGAYYLWPSSITVIGNASFNTLTIEGATNVTVSSIESILGDSTYQTVNMSGSVTALTVNGIDRINGTSGYDTVTLTGGVPTLTITGVESVTDVSGYTQAVNLSGSLNFVTLNGIETINGGSGYDAVTLTGSVGVLTITGIESLTDLSGNAQTVTITGYNGTDLTINGIETLHSSTLGSGDTITFGDGQSNLAYSSSFNSDTIIGNAGFNTLTLQSGWGTTKVSSIESVNGASGYNTIGLDNNGGTLFASGNGIAAIEGGTGQDSVILTGSISYLTVSGIESLSDWSGTNQTVSLSNRSANILTISGIETVYGSSGNDTITLDGQNNLKFATYSGGSDTIIGNAGFNALSLQGTSPSITVSSIESINGTGGTFAVTLADGGNTVTVNDIETIVGGSGYDAVTITGTSWFTPEVSGVESLTSDGSGSAFITGYAPSVTAQGFSSLSGDSMYQTVHLAGTSAAVLTINGIDVLYGTGGGDTITVSGGTASVIGGDGGDSIILSSGTATHQGVFFTASTDGSAAGVNSGYDAIYNFETSYDSIGIGGSLMSEINKGWYDIGITNRTGGTVDASSDEVVLLTATVSGSLVDSGYQNFRTALGSLTNDGGSSLIVIADNGTDTGVYLVKSDATGGVDAGEVSLLGLVSGRTGLGFDNITVYAP